MVLTEYALRGLIYIGLKEILKVRPYAKGIRTMDDLITKKGYKDVITGKVTKGQLIQVEDNNTGRQPKFVNKNEILSLFDTDSDDVKILEQAPPILCADDLVFFKDDDGVEHHVLMRGERKKDKIFFKLKDVEKVFQMERLDKMIYDPTTIYTEHMHYKWFKVEAIGMFPGIITTKSDANSEADDEPKKRQRSKELYFTYIGLKHLIEASRSGVAYKFKSWLDDVLFAVSFGTVDQKAKALARSFDMEVDHLKAIISKTSNDISCIYLIDVKLTNDTNKKPIYKYGFTKHLSRRMYEHKRKYGDNIELVYWALVPEQFLSDAETKIRDSLKPQAYTSKPSEKELICLNDDDLKAAISMYDVVSKKYQGSATEIKHYYEDKIKDAKHETELIKKDMAILETKMEAKDQQLEAKDQQLEAKDRQIDDQSKEIQWLRQMVSRLMKEG